MKLAPWIFGLALSLCAASTMAGPPFTTGDTSTPELHHYDLTVGVTSSQVQGSETQAFPSLNLSYGYLNNLQLSVGLTGMSVRNSGHGRTVGFGDITPEVKWRFLEETKSRPQIALDYVLKIPTASRSRGLGTGCFDHTLLLQMQKNYKRSSFIGNIGGTFLGDANSRNFLNYGLAYTYQLSETLVVGAELYGNTSAAAGMRDELAWALGVSLNIAPDKALLLKAGRSEHGLSDLNITAGIQFDFK